MKKVVAILGSPRKGETDTILKLFEEKLKSNGQIDFEHVFLKDYALENCKGCLQCFGKGEKHCPNKDDRDKIMAKLMEADGVIFASPVYSLQVSALLKNLLDRLAYVFHRPQFFHKVFIPIVTQGVYGDRAILKYLDQVAHFWGFITVPGIGLNTPPGVRTPKEQKTIADKVQKGADAFYRRLEGNLSPKPGFRDVAMFRMVRTLKPYIEGMDRDYEYFKEKGWMQSDYFYDVKLGLAKKLFGRFMDGQGAKMGKKMQQSRVSKTPAT